MKLKELLDGSPAGCVGVDDVLFDQRGVTWLRGDAEVFDGEPDHDRPYRIRRSRTVGLDLEAMTTGHASLLEIPQEDVKKRPPRVSSQNPPPGWLPVTLWRPWEQRR
jgi:hypothetical protein